MSPLRIGLRGYSTSRSRELTPLTVDQLVAMYSGNNVEVLIIMFFKLCKRLSTNPQIDLLYRSTRATGEFANKILPEDKLCFLTHVAEVNAFQ
ncbi:MAG: hypothetical protein QXV11_06430 [Desulfurococcaceae archaeon]